MEKIITYTDAMLGLIRLKPVNYHEAWYRLNRILSGCKILKLRKLTGKVKNPRYPIVSFLRRRNEVDKWILEDFYNVYPSSEPRDPELDGELEEEEIEYNNSHLFIYSGGNGLEYETFYDAIDDPLNLSKFYHLSLFFRMLASMDVEREHFQHVAEILQWNFTLPTRYSQRVSFDKFYRILNKVKLGVFAMAFQVSVYDTQNMVLDIENDMVWEGGYGDWPPHIDTMPYLLEEWYRGQPFIKAYEEAQEWFEKDRSIGNTIIQIWERCYVEDSTTRSGF